MYCSNCGKEIEDGARFCSSCGAAVVSNVPPQPETPPEAQTAQAQSAQANYTQAQFAQAQPSPGEVQTTWLMECHHHWFVFAWRGAIALFAVYSALRTESIWCFAVAAFFGLWAYVKYSFDYLELTSTEVVQHKGFINSTRIACPLASIQNIGYGNGLWGKVFRYHNVIIDNAGTGKAEYKWRCMSNVPEFVEAVKMQRASAKPLYYR